MITKFQQFNEYRNQLEIPFDDKHPLHDKPEHVDIVDAMITMNISKKYPNFDDKNFYDYSYYFHHFKKEAFEKWLEVESEGGGINLIHNFFYNNSDYTDEEIYIQEAISKLDFDNMDEDEIIIELCDNVYKYLTKEGLEEYKEFSWNTFLEEIEDNLWGIEENIDENGFLPIYRAMELNKSRSYDDTRSKTFLYDTMTESNIGNCWTYDDNMSFAKNNLSSVYYTFEGLISIDDINWVQTICRSGWTLKDEEEVYIDHGKPIKLVGIKNPDGKELKLPQGIIIEA